MYKTMFCLAESEIYIIEIAHLSEIQVEITKTSFLPMTVLAF